MPEFDFLIQIDLFRKSLSEQKSVISQFWQKADMILNGSGIRLKPIPKSFTSLKHNYFSVLFIALFFLLEIPIERLKLYAKLNHCLRSWVTACDNLLDHELKEIIVTDLPENAHTFKSVHTLLITDRIFFSFLLDGVKENIISHGEMERLLNISLTSISASGREEAEEEGGVGDPLPPEEVLSRIHSAKTGQLFTSPLAAPLSLGDIPINNGIVRKLLDGLVSFGLGCQILDDISDIGMDIHDRKHNYLISLILHNGHEEEKNRLRQFQTKTANTGIRTDPALYQQFPSASKKALMEATERLQTALTLLSRAGLPLSPFNRKNFIEILVRLYQDPKRLLHLRDR